MKSIATREASLVSKGTGCEMQVCDLRWYSWRYEMSLSQSVVVASPTLAGCRKEESVVGCVETGVFITAVWDISQLHDNGNGGWARGGGGD